MKLADGIDINKDPYRVLRSCDERTMAHALFGCANHTPPRGEEVDTNNHGYRVSEENLA